MRFLRSASLLVLFSASPASRCGRPARLPPVHRRRPARRLRPDAAELAQADVVLFGEQHNDALAHWLELQVAKDLLKLKKPGQLVLGMEMFERDVQPLVAQYAAGTLADTAFERQARPWPNYATDYRPLLQFARENHVPVIGTNAPRPFAQAVAQRQPHGARQAARHRPRPAGAAAAESGL